MNRRRLSLIVTACAAAPWLAACDRGSPAKPASFQAVDISGAGYADRLDLPDTDGRVRTLAEFKGKAVVVFFGYTQCPDVCPTTMADLATVKRQLGPDGAKLQAIFVTLDPERDTPEILKAYVANFDPGFIALRGTVQQTQDLAKSFKVFFQKVPGTEQGNYTFDHTAGAYVFDPQGRVRLFARYGQPVAAWAADLKQLLANG